MKVVLDRFPRAYLLQDAGSANACTSKLDMCAGGFRKSCGYMTLAQSKQHNPEQLEAQPPADAAARRPEASGRISYVLEALAGLPHLWECFEVLHRST